MDDSETYVNVKFTKTDSQSPSRETQRILDRMDDSETYMTMQIVKPDSPSPSGAEPNVSYVECHFKTLSVTRVQTNGNSQTSTDSELIFGKVERLIDEGEDPPIASGPGELRVTAQTDDLTSTYSELNFRKDDPLIDEDEDPPFASRPRKMSTTAQTAVQEQQSKGKIGNRPSRLICLLCLVTAALIVTVVALPIHVSQIRQSKITTDRNYPELNSSLQSKLSALNSTLSDLKRMHSDLRHQFTEMETKFRSVNETKAQICELLTSRKEQTCSENWVRNKDRCYYVSTFQTSFYKAMYECSNRYSRLLQIKSSDEVSFVSQNLVHRNLAYWIGKCKSGNVGLGLLYKVSSGTSDCGYCNPNGGRYHCGRDQRFICEKSAPFAEKIQGLCQQPVEAT